MSDQLYLFTYNQLDKPKIERFGLQSQQAAKSLSQVQIGLLFKLPHPAP